VYTFLIPSISSTCPAHLTLSHFVILIIFIEEYNLLIFSLWKLLHLHIDSSSGPIIIHFSSLSFMCRVNRHKTSHRKSTVWIVLITLQVNKNIKTRATGPVSKTTLSTLHNKGKHEDNN
jgi:hypothetical protein